MRVCHSKSDSMQTHGAESFWIDDMTREEAEVLAQQLLEVMRSFKVAPTHPWAGTPIERLHEGLKRALGR